MEREIFFFPFLPLLQREPLLYGTSAKDPFCSIQPLDDTSASLFCQNKLKTPDIPKQTTKPSTSSGDTSGDDETTGDA
jgi:hypothetical protein